MPEGIDQELYALIVQMYEIRHREIAKLKNDGMTQEEAEGTVNTTLWNDSEYHKIAIRYIKLSKTLNRINVVKFSLPSFLGPELYKSIFQWRSELDESIFSDDSEAEDYGRDLLSGSFVKDVARNYLELIPPFVNSDIPEAIRLLYAESRWCYVFQNCCASVALCRAIVEAAFKIKTGKDLSEPVYRLRKNVEHHAGFGKISKTASWIANVVILPANKVLHEAQSVEKDKAKKVVEKTREFLEEMFKTDVE